MSHLRDRVRANLLPYTRLAFCLLPARAYSRTLDIGCGTGVPTLFLAGLTGGEIVGLDHDAAALEVLRKRAREEGLEGRVMAQEGSLEAISFLDGSFDLLWCEGALHVLGFRESLRRWRRLLVPGGYLVAHDDALDLGEKADSADEEGYTLHAVFMVPEEVWWREYCAPAEAGLSRLVAEGGDAEPDHEALREEILRYREASESFRSAYFVLEKTKPSSGRPAGEPQTPAVPRERRSARSVITIQSSEDGP